MAKNNPKETILSSQLKIILQPDKGGKNDSNDFDPLKYLHRNSFAMTSHFHSNLRKQITDDEIRDFIKNEIIRYKSTLNKDLQEELKKYIQEEIQNLKCEIYRELHEKIQKDINCREYIEVYNVLSLNDGLEDKK